MRPSFTIIEQCANGVVMETTITSDEIRYAVKQHGAILFNKSLSGRVNYRYVLVYAREQEQVAALAAATIGGMPS